MGGEEPLVLLSLCLPFSCCGSWLYLQSGPPLATVLEQWVAGVGGCWWQQLCHSILAALVPPASRFLHLRSVQRDAGDSALFWGFLGLPPAL